MCRKHTLYAASITALGGLAGCALGKALAKNAAPVNNAAPPQKQEGEENRLFITGVLVLVASLAIKVKLDEFLSAQIHKNPALQQHYEAILHQSGPMTQKLEKEGIRGGNIDF